MTHFLDYMLADFAQTSVGNVENHFTGKPDDLTVIFKGISSGAEAYLISLDVSAAKSRVFRKDSVKRFLLYE
ncbi:hypothetical protein [Pseudomonas aeruginosa]|uniref:hypothetical protein n=1 Tax=Pseudomonas aeruginosa TaxID=287 RepID=UPI002E16F45B|nr:hypothetical protein [Pseudomonas aeruginosa]